MMNKNEIRSFEDLECWKACRETRNYITEMTKSFPTFERYALTDGMRRDARSITENIAEGYGRFHSSENTQFCRISRGSLYELMDQLLFALDNGYINEEEYNRGRQKLEKSTRLLNGYINYLNKAKKRTNNN